MKKFTVITCPYCDTEHRIFVEGGLSIVVCDIEYGGCDKDFVIKVEFEVKVKVFKLQEVKK